MLRRGIVTLLAVAAGLAVVAGASAQAPSGDPTQYCVGNGGPLGIASDAEHTVLLGEAPLPPGVRSSRLNVDGVSTRVLQTGPQHARDAVVFVHGNPGSARDWDQLLVAGGKYTRAVSFDISGYGKSDKGAAAVQSTDGAARFINRLLQELHVERAVLVVHDFGGPWGLQWAVQHPAALTAAVLIDSGVLIDYVPHPFAVVWATPTAGELQMASTTRQSFDETIQGSGPRPLPQEFVDRMYDNYDRAERCAALRYYRSAAANQSIGREQAAVLRKRSRPALVIWGGGDLFIPSSQAEKQRQAFPAAQIHIFDNSGHWPFIDNAEKTRVLFDAFLRPVLTVRRPHPLARTRHVHVPVQVRGVVPAHQVRVRLGRLGVTRRAAVSGSRDLVIQLRHGLQPGRHVLMVKARGLPSQRLVLHVRPRR